MRLRVATVLDCLTSPFDMKKPNIQALAADLVSRIHHSPDSPTNLATTVAGILEREFVEPVEPCKPNAFDLQAEAEEAARPHNWKPGAARPSPAWRLFLDRLFK